MDPPRSSAPPGPWGKLARWRCHRERPVPDPGVPAARVRRRGRRRRSPEPRARAAGVGGGALLRRRAMPESRRARAEPASCAAIRRGSGWPAAGPPAMRRRSRRCRPGSRWRPIPSTPTWCTRTPGTSGSAALLVKKLHDIPLVVTLHSIEPLRPWKADQLGRGYEVSTWAERAAVEQAERVIAVSATMRDDILRHFRRRSRARGHAAQRRGRRRVPRDELGATRSSGTACGRRTRSSSGASASRRASSRCSRRRRRFPPDVELVLVRGEPRHARDRGAARRRGGEPAARALDQCHAAARRRGAALQHARRVRLPVDLRAVRADQPRGDGVRHGRRGEPRRRHPRGGRGRRDRRPRAAGRPEPRSPPR